VPTAQLTPNPRNARTHSKKQLKQIRRSIETFGFTNPILADDKGMIIAGHGRHLAALEMGLATVPVTRISGLSEVSKRALMLADNKIASGAGWDREKLAVELPELSVDLEAEGTDITITGFFHAEIDQISVDFGNHAADPADDYNIGDSKSVSQPGDLWLLSQHRLLCGNARSKADLDRLDGKLAEMAFLDPV
jgi:hypothetical protein